MIKSRRMSWREDERIQCFGVKKEGKILLEALAMEGRIILE
jgi:hypothetical protein